MDEIVVRAAEAWFGHPRILDWPVRRIVVRQGEQLAARVLAPEEDADGLSFPMSGSGPSILLVLTRSWAEHHFPPEDVLVSAIGYRAQALPWDPGQIGWWRGKLQWQPSPGGSAWLERWKKSRLSFTADVECLGEMHRIEVRNGRIRFVNHSWEEAELLGHVGEGGCWAWFERWREDNRHHPWDRSSIKADSVFDPSDARKSAATRLMLLEMRKMGIEPAARSWDRGRLSLSFVVPGHPVRFASLDTDPITWFRKFYLNRKWRQGDAFVLPGEKLWLVRPGRVRIEWIVRSF